MKGCAKGCAQGNNTKDPFPKSDSKEKRDIRYYSLRYMQANVNTLLSGYAYYDSFITDCSRKT